MTGSKDELNSIFNYFHFSIDFDFDLDLDCSLQRGPVPIVFPPIFSWVLMLSCVLQPDIIHMSSFSYTVGILYFMNTSSVQGLPWCDVVLFHPFFRGIPFEEDFYGFRWCCTFLKSILRSLTYTISSFLGTRFYEGHIHCVGNTWCSQSNWIWSGSVKSPSLKPRQLCFG